MKREPWSGVLKMIVEDDAMMSPLYLVVSIDVEEDNWRPTQHNVTVENVRELPRLHEFLHRLQLRPTYFVGYPVANTTWAAEILRGINEEGHAELGAHLHPWNTPPCEEAFLPRHTMLKNLPYELQHAKIETLRDTLKRVIGVAPTSFRAGRMGLGAETVTALIRSGFQVDSSVTPFITWEDDGGADFAGAPMGCYRLDGRGDVRVPVPDGPLCEVPLSCGFTARPFEWRASAHRILRSAPFRWLRLAGIASRVGLVRRVIGSPETSSGKDLIALSRCLLDENVPFVHLYLHSPSLVPGLNPSVSSVAERERLYSVVESYVDAIARLTPIRPATVSEVAEAFCALPGPARAAT